MAFRLSSPFPHLLLKSSKKGISLSENYVKNPLVDELYPSSVTSKYCFSLYCLIFVITNKKFFYIFHYGLNCAPTQERYLRVWHYLEIRFLQMQSSCNKVISAGPNPTWPNPKMSLMGKFGYRNRHTQREEDADAWRALWEDRRLECSSISQGTPEATEKLGEAWNRSIQCVFEERVSNADEYCCNVPVVSFRCVFLEALYCSMKANVSQ